MCLNPTSFFYTRPDGSRTSVPRACQECSKCLNAPIEDMVGRNLAERHYAAHSYAITLTYAGGDGARAIHPKDAQAFVRSLRDRGHHVRYLIVGEHGTRKGRAHFHSILHTDKPIEVKLNEEKVSLDPWPHGYVYAERAQTSRAIYYVAKYVAPHKSDDVWKTLSKKPILGARLFEDIAEDYAASCLWPHDLMYTPPGSNRRYGLRGTARDFFCEQLLKRMPVPEEHEISKDMSIALAGWARRYRRKNLLDTEKPVVERWRQPPAMPDWVHFEQGFENGEQTRPTEEIPEAAAHVETYRRAHGHKKGFNPRPRWRPKACPHLLESADDICSRFEAG